MDLLTQALVGAAAGGATRIRVRHQPGNLHRAMLLGASAALLADADVFLGDPSDPIVAQSLHRHFTHALAFVPFGALLVAGLWRLIEQTRTDRTDVLAQNALVSSWTAAAAGLLTAGLLDACTGYGTHLLWPFSDARTAWNVISIVDPLFTLPVAACAIVAWRRRSARACAAALLVGLAWLGVGVAQRERVEAAIVAVAEARGDAPTQVLARPSIGNLLLWRGLYRTRDQNRDQNGKEPRKETHGGTGDRWHVLAVRAGLGTPTHHWGPSVPALSRAASREHAQALGMDPAAADRFHTLSGGVVTPTARGLGDLRFAMLPDSAAPLWQLEATPDGVRWTVGRALDDEARAHFLALLAGRAPSSPPDAPRP